MVIPLCLSFIPSPRKGFAIKRNFKYLNPFFLKFLPWKTVLDERMQMYDVILIRKLCLLMLNKQNQL